MHINLVHLIFCLQNDLIKRRVQELGASFTTPEQQQQLHQSNGQRQQPKPTQIKLRRGSNSSLIDGKDPQNSQDEGDRQTNSERNSQTNSPSLTNSQLNSSQLNSSNTQTNTYYTTQVEADHNTQESQHIQGKASPASPVTVHLTQNQKQ